MLVLTLLLTVNIYVNTYIILLKSTSLTAIADVNVNVNFLFKNNYFPSGNISWWKVLVLTLLLTLQRTAAIHQESDLIQILLLTLLLTVNIYVNTYIILLILSSLTAIINVNVYADRFTRIKHSYFRNINYWNYNKYFSVNNIVNC